MTYLVILVLVAAAAIAKLWWQQRRQRAHLTSADDFRASLERIAQHRPSRSLGVRPSRTHAPSRRRQPLDPARRAAAKRRLEARRRARIAS